MKRMFPKIGLGIGICLVASSSFGDEGRGYPGLFCVENNAAGSPDIRFNNTGAAENIAATTKDFQCPAVKNDLLRVTQWVTTVYRSAASANTAWSVSLWDANADGSAGYVTTITVPTGAGTKVDLFSSGMGNYPGTGQLRIYSSVPAGCRIHSYYTVEGT